MRARGVGEADVSLIDGILKLGIGITGTGMNSDGGGLGDLCGFANSRRRLRDAVGVRMLVVCFGRHEARWGLESMHILAIRYRYNVQGFSRLVEKAAWAGSCPTRPRLQQAFDMHAKLGHS